MGRKKIIAPSILSADFANLEKEIRAVSQAGADWIHVDVMDGHFVPNLTIGIPVVAALKPISLLPLDVHLMIEKPERYVADFVKAGADYLTIHVESTQNPSDVLAQIRNMGCKPGITLRPQTSVDSILPFLSQVDLVLVMTVEPGFGGQKFMIEQLDKVKKVRTALKQMNSSALIEVDGGINAETAALCNEVDVLVAGNYIFKNDYKQAIQSLRLAV